jgi:hypothetical protein
LTAATWTEPLTVFAPARLNEPSTEPLRGEALK